MTTLPRRLLLALSLIALLMLGACSTGLKLGYDNLERLALWEVDDYIDLDDPQKALFRMEFRALHGWHRQTQLRLYAADLRRFATVTASNAPLGAAATQTLSLADGHGQRLWEQAQPGIERLLAAIDDRQIADYDSRRRRKLEAEVAERADDSLDDRRKRWLREWRNSLDRWLGKLNPQQDALLDAAWTARIPELGDPAERARERLASHARFIDALTDRARPGLIARLTAQADARDKARDDADQARERALVAMLFDAADARQRKRLLATLGTLADDFDTLAARPASVPAARP